MNILEYAIVKSFVLLIIEDIDCVECVLKREFRKSLKIKELENELKTEIERKKLKI